MGWVLSNISQFSVFIIQIVWVPRRSSCLDEFPVIVFMIQSLKKPDHSHGKWKQVKPILITQNLIFSGMFVNRRRLWAPKASHIPPVTLSFLFFSFFPFFSTFLSFSLFLYMFFFRAKSSYSPTTHTHSILFAFFRFSVLSFFFFSHRSLTCRPMPTQAERSSASIFNHTPKSSTTLSFSSSLLSYPFFDLAEASKSASTVTIFSASTATI